MRHIIRKATLQKGKRRISCGLVRHQVVKESSLAIYREKLDITVDPELRLALRQPGWIVVTL